MPRVIESVSRVSGFEDALKVTNVKIETNEGEIIIKLENYLLSKRSHAIAGDEGICPMAMSVTAMIQNFKQTSRNRVFISSSKRKCNKNKGYRRIILQTGVP